MIKTNRVQGRPPSAIQNRSHLRAAGGDRPYENLCVFSTPFYSCGMYAYTRLRPHLTPKNEANIRYPKEIKVVIAIPATGKGSRAIKAKAGRIRGR